MKKEHAHKQEAQKKCNTASKKMGCPAMLYMREVVIFPDNKVCWN